jgi:hypothetical protein
VIRQNIAIKEKLLLESKKNSDYDTKVVFTENQALQQKTLELPANDILKGSEKQVPEDQEKQIEIDKAKIDLNIHESDKNGNEFE